MNKRFLLGIISLSIGMAVQGQTTKNKKPNIILIYTDDLGYGDVSSYGTSAIQTPNIDRLAKNGVRFTNAHATSATCTPSRFSLLTGKYAWRKEGTGIAPGDATLLIPVTTTTLPGMLQKAGYNTAVIGKWHLGLGDAKGINWNEKITPGPAEIGFNYSFLIPATGDRVPCVFVENQEVINL
ncbi:MAG TPA: sulfatase-like hydrolase/transferase, partial [Lacibacter sp.]|nr:sulfatase-like hydrolase/transferase [Lacibacter sp.]